MRLTADRRGNIEKEWSMQDCLLEGLYRHRTGRMLLQPLLSPRMSRMGAKVMDARVSALWIPFFIRHHAIAMEDYERVRYRSFNDFFTRKLAEGARTVEQAPQVFVSPCDSRLSVYKIDDACTFSVKHTVYTVESLLKSRRLAERFAGGFVWVFRLCVDDYHRYIYVDHGMTSKYYRIPGVFHTVNPVANEVFPVYKENRREYCLLKSEHFGTVLQMEVGAMFVGRIENRPAERMVCRGEEKGHFAFGGSTVIVMTQKGQVVPDGDILRCSKSGAEVRVKMGERVGMKRKGYGRLSNV